MKIKTKLGISCLFILLFLSFSVMAQSNVNDKKDVFAKRNDPVKLKNLADQFIVTNEGKLSENLNPINRVNLLMYLSQAYFASGDMEKTEAVLQQLSENNEELKRKTRVKHSDGQVQHIYYIISGQVALEKGDIEKAKESLLLAGNVQSSPVLKSFGPNLVLAKKLLEKGERETVIQYFDLCANFWSMDDGRLAKWKESVKKGEMPNFGIAIANLTNEWMYANV